MAFVVRDPWRLQFFKDVACPEHVRIAVDDLDCWEWHPELRHIYDKLYIAQSQGVACGLRDDEPRYFPVFAKPRINLHGLGYGTAILRNVGDFRAAMTDGLMWMAFFEGPHVSTDCAVVKGEVQWLRHATGIPLQGAMFERWIIHAAADNTLAATLRSWIAQELPGYTGMVNIETIGGRIIETQLRFADQWCDLNGTGWLEAVVELYASGRWSFRDDMRKDVYSVPLFAGHGMVPPHPPRALQDEIRAREGISSLQITYHEGKASAAHHMPPGGFRLGIVNAWDLQAALQARRDLAAGFPGIACILPE